MNNCKYYKNICEAEYRACLEERPEDCPINKEITVRFDKFLRVNNYTLAEKKSD